MKNVVKNNEKCHENNEKPMNAVLYNSSLEVRFMICSWREVHFPYQAAERDVEEGIMF